MVPQGSIQAPTALGSFCPPTELEDRECWEIPPVVVTCQAGEMQSAGRLTNVLRFTLKNPFFS